MHDGQPLMRGTKAIAAAARKSASVKKALLAQRARHVIVGPAFAFVGLAARQQRLGGAIARRIHIEAFAFLESLALAKFVGRRFAVRRAVRGHRTDDTPLTPGDLVRRDRLSAASLVISLARVFKSSMVSLGLFSVGSIEDGFSSNFPISLRRPGFSLGCAGSGDGAGSLVCGAGEGSAWTDGAGCGAACGHAESDAAAIVSNPTIAMASCARDVTIQLPIRSDMTMRVSRWRRDEKRCR